MEHRAQNPSVTRGRLLAVELAVGTSARCFLDSFSPACGRTGVGTYGAEAVGHKVLGDAGLAWASAKRPGLLRHSLPTRDLAPATNIFFIFN